LRVVGAVGEGEGEAKYGCFSVMRVGIVVAFEGGDSV
jgi:hypothetical protein